MNCCINLKLRSKKGVKYFYCVRKRAVVDQKECWSCLNRETKKTSKMVVKTRLKPISKKRVCVSKKTYNEVYERDNGRCRLCGAVDNLQLHHIYYRSERKDLIDDPNNCIMLCHRDFSKNKCHKLVHNNKKKYQPMLLEIMAQKKTD